MRNIEEALQQHKQVILDAGYNENQILGIFLYGSQNYGLATENSDVDSKVIIIPSLEDLCQGKRGFVKEYTYKKEKVIVMDILHYFDNLKKQNINYVETLFTDYKWINPNYRHIWIYLMSIRDFIAYYDMNKAVQSMGHQALHTLKQNSADPKKFAMATYIAHFLDIYIEGHLYKNPYEVALKPEPHLANYLIALKTGKKNYTATDVINLRKEFEKIIEKKFSEDIEHKAKVDKKLLEIAVSAIKFFDKL